MAGPQAPDPGADLAPPGPRLREGDVLPAERRDLAFRTEDGLLLVGELALPLHVPPVATLLCLHPLPTHGGFMDSHLIRKASYRLPAQAGIAVLRFNTRGTTSPHGTSEGAFDEAEGERHDLAAAVDLLRREGLPALWLLGWSFGTDLVLRYGCVPEVEGAVLLSPTLRWSRPSDLQRWADSGKPLTAVVPELDDFLRPAQAQEAFRAVPHAEVVEVPGAKHLLFGRTEAVLGLVVDRVLARDRGVGA
jgi:alpha/beta superfamily hydrolase